MYALLVEIMSRQEKRSLVNLGRKFCGGFSARNFENVTKLLCDKIGKMWAWGSEQTGSEVWFVGKIFSFR